MSPTVAIAAPLYNHAKHLREALESLLLQQYTDVGLVLVDDCSTDETCRIVTEYAERDARVIYQRNATRLGYIKSARRSFELACQLFPTARYFAWGSDHDVWHPRWLGSLVEVLETYPEVVLAYPLNIRVGDRGELIRVATWRFDTSGVTSPAARVWRVSRGMSAGNMVYGLYRKESLKRTGGLRMVLIPDRLLLAELSAQGEFKQVPEILWYRRYTGLASLRRQLAASFFAERPFYLRAPWWSTHAVFLFRDARAAGGRSGLRVAFVYVCGTLLHRMSRNLRRSWNRIRSVPSAARSAVRRLASRVSARMPAR